MVEFLQLVLLLLAIAVSLASARSGHDARPSGLVALVRRFAAKQGLVVAAIGCATFLGCLSVAAYLHEPVPRIPDEFSYLLLGDTLASGRVANPAPSLPEFFDTLHVLVRPVYVSKYFPAQGVFLALGEKLTGHSAVGVWTSSALACAAVCWMLQAWVGPMGGLLGGLLMMVQLGIYSYWSQTFWGGMGSVDIPGFRLCRAEQQIPHPAKLAGIRDDKRAADSRKTWMSTEPVAW